MSARAAGAALLVAVLASSWPGALAAQADPDTGGIGVTITMHAGGTAFTRFQSVTLEAEGAPRPDYPAAITASTSASLGADVTLWFQPWLGLRLDLLYAPSNFELRLAEVDRVEILGEESDYRGLDYSDVSLFSMSLAGMLALPIPSRHIAPYTLFGAGAALLVADDRGANGLDEAFEDGSGAAFDFAGIVGIGVKIPLRSESAGRVSLSFELVDRITPSPILSGDGRVLLDDGEVRVINALHEADLESDARFVHSVAIAAGLTFATGGETPNDRAQ